MTGFTRTDLRDREAVAKFLKMLHDRAQFYDCYGTASAIDRAYQSYMQGDCDMNDVAEMLIDTLYVDGVILGTH